MFNKSLFLSLVLIALGISNVVNAIPLRKQVDTASLEAARTAIDKEAQAKQLPKDKNIKNVEKYCLMILKVRLGQGYSNITIADRRVPLPEENDQTKYSVAGNAEGNPPLSYLCNVNVSQGIIQLKELQLFHVIKPK